MGKIWNFVKRLKRKKSNIGSCLIVKHIVILTTSLNTDRRSAYYSKRLKWLLDAKKIEYDEIDLSLLDKEAREDYMSIYKESRDILPIMYIDNKFAGDYDQIQELEDKRKLESHAFTAIKLTEKDYHNFCSICAFDK